eukprot:scaffold823_cov397-Prasinococcus_capsulatus_cf.AAC.7
MPRSVIVTTSSEAKPPARSATWSASRDERRAAALTRTLARTDTHMPVYPATPEHVAPSMKERAVKIARVVRSRLASICSLVGWRNRYTIAMAPDKTTERLAIVPYWVPKKPSAPSLIALDTSCISLGPSSLARTQLTRYIEKNNMTKHTRNVQNTTVWV